MFVSVCNYFFRQVGLILMVSIKIPIGTIGFYHLNHYMILFCSVIWKYSIRI